MTFVFLSQNMPTAKSRRECLKTLARPPIARIEAIFKKTIMGRKIIIRSANGW